jgi:hypothetical protein
MADEHDFKTNEDRYLHAREVVEAALTDSRQLGEAITPIIGDEGVKRVVEALGKITGARKLAEAQRTAITKPLLDEKRTIDNRFKELTGPLDGAEQALKDAVAAYRRKVEQERRERIAREERNRRERQAREDAKAEAERREPIRHESARIEPAPEATIRSGGSAATVRKVWKAEVIDPDAVPRDYLTVDTAAINRAVKAGTREIPGVRIWKDDQVAVS